MFLLLLAVFPSIYLMHYIYQHDQVEKEPIGLLGKIFLAGVLSAVPAVVGEVVMHEFLDAIFQDSSSVFYLLVENFIAVALVEEYCKRFMIHRVTWNNSEFNYSFDGIVYCVCGSLGFATLENILYIFQDGGSFEIAIARALMAIPLHAFCGVYMGYYYGLAKQAAVNEYEARASALMFRSLMVPVLIHGAYDFILSIESDLMMLVIVAFCIALDVIAVRRIKEASRDDMPLWF